MYDDLLKRSDRRFTNILYRIKSFSVNLNFFDFIFCWIFFRIILSNLFVFKLFLHNQNTN